MIVFRSSDGADRLLIKRVIGLPGDLVAIRQGAVLVNSEALPRHGLSAEEWEALSRRFRRTGLPPPAQAAWESVGQTRYQVVPGRAERSDDSREIECRVPAGHLYVLGDNRSGSIDSRHWGPIRVERVVGRMRG